MVIRQIGEHTCNIKNFENVANIITWLHQNIETSPLFYERETDLVSKKNCCKWKSITNKWKVSWEPKSGYTIIYGLEKVQFVELMLSADLGEFF